MILAGLHGSTLAISTQISEAPLYCSTFGIINMGTTCACFFVGKLAQCSYIFRHFCLALS